MHAIGGSDPRVERVNVRFPSMPQSELLRRRQRKKNEALRVIIRPGMLDTSVPRNLQRRNTRRECQKIKRRPGEETAKGKIYRGDVYSVGHEERGKTERS